MYGNSKRLSGAIAEKPANTPETVCVSLDKPGIDKHMKIYYTLMVKHVDLSQ